MTFDNYMTALKELSEWLQNYRRVSLQSRSITIPISGIKREANRRPTRATTLDKLDIIHTVNVHLNNLLGGTEGYPEMYEGPSDTPENKLMKLLFTEPDRLRQIMRNGYLPLFNSVDEDRARVDFRRTIKNTGTIGNFHKATKIIVAKIDEVSSRPETEDLVYDLYIAIREIGSAPPMSDIYRPYRMNELFGGNVEDTDRYCHKVNKFTSVLDKLEPIINRVELDRNTLITDAEYLFETCIDNLEELYVDLCYARILSAV